MLQCGAGVMPLCVLLSPVQVSRPVCVDVPSETEAVVGNPMKLTCISCMKREEVSAETRVDWYYIPPDEGPIPVGLLHPSPPFAQTPTSSISLQLFHLMIGPAIFPDHVT